MLIASGFSFQLESDIRKDESTPLLLTIEDVQRRAELRLAARRSGEGQEPTVSAPSESRRIEFSENVPDGGTGGEMLHFDVGLDPLKAQELREKTEQRWRELRSAEERCQKAKSKLEGQVQEWQAQQVDQNEAQKMTATSGRGGEEAKNPVKAGQLQQNKEDEKKREWEDLLVKERAAAEGRRSTRCVVVPFLCMC